MGDTDGTWQDVLRTQQEELRRLELMNEALDAGTGQLDADINKALKKTSTKLATTSRPSSSSRPTSAPRGRIGPAIGLSPRHSRGGRDLVAGLDEDVPDIPHIQVNDHGALPEPAPPSSPDIDPKAPDTVAKYYMFAALTI